MPKCNAKIFQIKNLDILNLSAEMDTMEMDTKSRQKRSL